MPFPLTPEEEASFWKDLQQKDQQFQDSRLQALRQPAVAANLGQIHVAAPGAAPGVKLSLAQGSAAGMIPLQQAISAALASYAVAPDNPANVIRGAIQGGAKDQRSLASRGWDVVMGRHGIVSNVFGHNAAPPERAPGMDTLQRNQQLQQYAAANDPIRQIGATAPAQLVNRDVIQPVLNTREGEFVKGAARLGFAAMNTPLQIAQSYVLNANQPPPPEGQAPATTKLGPFNFPQGQDPLTVAKSTDLGAMIANRFGGRPVSALVSTVAPQYHLDAGKGFLPGGLAEVQRKAAERAVRGVIPGSGILDANGNPIPGTEETRTIGRSTALALFEPGSYGYRAMSGAVDAGFAWYFDPTSIAGKAVHEAREIRSTITPAAALTAEDLQKALRPGEKIADHPEYGKGLFRFQEPLFGTAAAPAPPSSIAERARNIGMEFVPLEKIQSDARSIRRAEAGAIDAERWTVSPRPAETWMQSPKGKQFAAAVAQDNDVLSIGRAFNNQLDPLLLTKLADASTPEAVSEIMLNEVLGHGVSSVNDLSKVRAPGWWQSTRLAQQMPQGLQLMGVRGSTWQRIEAMNNLDRYLANAKVPYAERSAIVDQFVRGTNAADRYTALENSMKAVERSLLAYGTDPEIARGLTHFSAEAQAVRKYGVDFTGLHTDGGFLAQLQEQGWGLDENGNFVKLPEISNAAQIESVLKTGGYIRGDTNDILQAIGPQMLSEGLSDIAYLPNIREIRRLTSKWAPLLSATDEAGRLTGKLKPPLAFLEWLQQDVIKPLAIIRPAFLLRVIGEEQMRMAANGQVSMLRHPLDYIGLAMHNSAAWDAFGHDFDALVKRFGGIDAFDEYAAALHQGANGRGAKHLVDPLAAERQSFLTGSWSIVQKSKEPQLWEQGLANDEMRQMAADPVMRRIASGDSNDEISLWLSHDPEGIPVMDELRSFLANKAARTADGKWIPISLNADNNVVLSSYLDSLRDRLWTKVHNQQDLIGAIAHGTIGTAEETIPNAAIHVMTDGAGPRVVDPFTGKASTWVGSKVRLDDGRYGTIVNDAEQEGHSIVQVAGQAWDDQGRPSAALRKAVKDWRENDLSPEAVKYAVRAKQRVAGYRGEAAQGAGVMRDKVVNGFFAGAYGKTSDYLSRSPAFRQFYWQRMNDLADRLSPEEANIFLKNMETAAATHTQGSVAKLLGSDKRVDAAIEKAKNANGTLTVEQLDDYARGWALDKTKRLLYDASRRSQWTDIARVVFPFAEAWKEVLGTWARTIARDPTLVRRAQLVVQGGKDFDPEGDGQGFFHVNADGQYVFSIPFSSTLARYVTGNSGLEKVLSPLLAHQFGGATPIDQSLDIPWQRLNVGWSVVPSIGWIASSAVGKLIPEKPGFDELRSFLLPYGTAGNTWANVLMPSWAQKIWQGTFDSPSSTRLYGDTRLRVIQYLLSTGKYGNTPDELDRLNADATKQARAVTIVRGLAQALGPAAPTPDMNVTVHPPGQPPMDMMASALTKEYGRLLAENPQTALENFVGLYGDLATAYAVGRTRAVNGGLDTSKEFGKWERSHGKVFSDAPDAAGYFAPTGESSDMTVFNRQLATGQREKLTPAQYEDAVNETMGNRVYYTLRDAIKAQNAAVGRSSFTDEQSQYLRDARAKIYEKWPVSNPQSGDRASYQDQIRQIIRVIDYKQLQGNDIADAARQYLIVRDAALQEAQNRGVAGFGAQKTADLRAYMNQVGEALVAQTPDFKRLWEGVFAREVEG